MSHDTALVDTQVIEYLLYYRCPFGDAFGKLAARRISSSETPSKLTMSIDHMILKI